MIDSDREFQLLIWGYAIEGDVLEHDAMLAEEGGKYRTLWDRTRRELSDSMIDRGNGWERVPDWWALQHLPMEWREQQHAAEEDASCETCEDVILYEYSFSPWPMKEVRWKTCPTCGFGPRSYQRGGARV